MLEYVLFAERPALPLWVDSGVLTTLGVGVWGVLEHDRDKSVIGAQLRENLDAALEVMWQGLVENRHGGVIAVAHHISQQIDNGIRFN